MKITIFPYLAIICFTHYAHALPSRGALVAGSSMNNGLSLLEKECKIDPNLPLQCFNTEECAGHHRQGFKGSPVIPAKVKSIGKKLNLITDFDVIRQKLQGQISPYPRFALAGVVTTLALMAKLKLVPATKFRDQREASLTYGNLKYSAIQNNVAKIKSLIGDTKGLSDDELVMLWAQDEHIDLHSAFPSKPPVFKAAHLTSLNSFLKAGVANVTQPDGRVLQNWSPQTPNAADFPAGGANNKGWGDEGGWFESAKSIAGMLG